MRQLFVKTYKHQNRLVPLREALTPDGKGAVERNKWGRVVAVSENGHYIGVLVWLSASAWLETSEVRDLVAYKNPLGVWVWRQ